MHTLRYRRVTHNDVIAAGTAVCVVCVPPASRLSGRLPVVSGEQLISVLERLGWIAVRQRGSHVRLRHPDRPQPLVVPLHRELKRGTLSGVLRDAGVDADELRRGR
jgi:predicted RNA binding protein YcfA (HicA-like mRNA interferase family)